MNAMTEMREKIEALCNKHLTTDEVSAHESLASDIRDLLREARSITRAELIPWEPGQQGVSLTYADGVGQAALLSQSSPSGGGMCLPSPSAHQESSMPAEASRHVTPASCAPFGPIGDEYLSPHMLMKRHNINAERLRHTLDASDVSPEWCHMASDALEAAERVFAVLADRHNAEIKRLEARHEGQVRIDDAMAWCCSENIPAETRLEAIRSILAGHDPAGALTEAQSENTAKMSEAKDVTSNQSLQEGMVLHCWFMEAPDGSNSAGPFDTKDQGETWAKMSAVHAPHYADWKAVALYRSPSSISQDQEKGNG